MKKWLRQRLIKRIIGIIFAGMVVISSVIAFGSHSIKARITEFEIENDPESLIVTSEDGSQKFRIHDYFRFIPTGENWEIGDIVKIRYSGKILETEPATFENLRSVKWYAAGPVHYAARPSIMVDGVLYGDTGKGAPYRTDERPDRGGRVDGEITSTTEGHEYPSRDDQSNFGTGFFYRYGQENTVEVFFDSADKWIIFEAYEDN